MVVIILTISWSHDYHAYREFCNILELFNFSLVRNSKAYFKELLNDIPNDGVYENKKFHSNLTPKIYGGSDLSMRTIVLELYSSSTRYNFYLVG